MSVNKLNDAAVLQQLEGHWQKIAMLLVWKIAGRGSVVRITAEDMDGMARAFSPGIPILFTHGTADGFEFSIVDEAAAARIGAYEAGRKGTA